MLDFFFIALLEQVYLHKNAHETLVNLKFHTRFDVKTHIFIKNWIFIEAQFRLKNAKRRKVRASRLERAFHESISG